jgi:small GTP-binding protein
MAVPGSATNPFKIVIVGSVGVGKTSITKRAVAGSFPDVHQPTLGAAYMSKEVVVGDVTAHLAIWDTAGQERFRATVPTYYRNAIAAILVYAITDAESFREVDDWHQSLTTKAPPGIQLFLVGNKVDLSDKHRKVSAEEGQAKANEIGATFFEVSAQTGYEIEGLFTYVATRSLAKSEAHLVASSSAGGVALEDATENSPECC